MMLSACSTLNTIDDSMKNHLNPALDNISSTTTSLIPVIKSVRLVTDETTLLESNSLTMIASIKDVSDQANFSLILLSNEATNTLVELQKTLRVAQQTLSNVTEFLSETKKSVVEVNGVISNISPTIIQLNKTLKSIRLTTVSIHKSQFEYHQFIKKYWVVIVVVLIILILLSIFHSIIQRLILGKRNKI